MFFEHELMARSNEAEDIFERIVFDLFGAAAYFADNMVMVRFEWLCKLGERRPATDNRLGDTKLTKELECAVNACPVDGRGSTDDLSVFERFVGAK